MTTNHDIFETTSDGEIVHKPREATVAIDATDVGVRVILMHGKGADLMESPDLYIERKAGSWAVFVHPDSGDPTHVIIIPDKGTTRVEEM